MKKLIPALFASILILIFLLAPTFLEARGGRGGGLGGGFPGGGWGGHYRGYYGGYRGGYYRGFYGGGFYPYWGLWGWGFWGWPLLGWAYPGWPYISYAGYPYLGWPYYSDYSSYYSSDVATAPPVYNETEQPYYWYYCTNPPGYYPYIQNCPSGWLTVVPNVTPPPPPPGFTPPPSSVYPPPATEEPGTGNISPPSKPPVILQSFASKELRPGDVWKIYLKASDPEGEMKYIFATVSQPGVVAYPISIIRIKGENQKELSGYIYLNTPPTPQVNFFNLTLTLSVSIKGTGGFSQPAVFPLSFEATPTPEVPPEGVFKEQDLGPISVTLQGGMGGRAH